MARSIFALVFSDLSLSDCAERSDGIARPIGGPGIVRYPQCAALATRRSGAFKRISQTVRASARLFLPALAGIVQRKPRLLSGLFCARGSTKTMTHSAGNNRCRIAARQSRQSRCLHSASNPPGARPRCRRSTPEGGPYQIPDDFLAMASTISRIELRNSLSLSRVNASASRSACGSNVSGFADVRVVPASSVKNCPTGTLRAVEIICSRLAPTRSCRSRISGLAGM